MNYPQKNLLTIHSETINCSMLDYSRQEKGLSREEILKLYIKNQPRFKGQLKHLTISLLTTSLL